MKAEEKKANEFILKFRQIPPSSHYTGIDDREANACALVLVNELINHSKEIAMVYDLSFDESCNFYTKVKQQILRK